MVTFASRTEDALEALFRRHSGDPLQHGWRVRMRHQFRYFDPDSWYQAAVEQLVTEECRWIDVGGGKSIFPHEPRLSNELAQRCKYLVGVDPSDNIHQNELVDERHQCTIEQFHCEEPFDLATLRMVAEHIEQPETVVTTLAEQIRPGGHVVIYTPHKWSVLSILAHLIPDSLHATLARLAAPDRQDEDVFPTCFRMNTRKQLNSLFERGGFREVAFSYLDDCSVLQRFPVTCFLELTIWKMFRTLGLRYPENNLLGVYQRQV